MTWEVLFCFKQILLLCWCHYTCLLYSLIKQMPGWDSIAEFLSVLDNTVSSSLLSLASDCSERLQVPLVWWPYIFCQGSALVFYNWSHRWGSHVLWCSFSKDCQGSAMNDVPQYFALLRGWVSYLYSAEFPFSRLVGDPSLPVEGVVFPLNLTESASPEGQRCLHFVARICYDLQESTISMSLSSFSLLV